MPGLFVRVEAFLEQEFDDSDRKDLERLLDRARKGDEAALQDLEERFSGPLRFGTAGIRGILGVGESRMNRSLVLRVTYGLVRHLLENVPDARSRGVALGRDGRRLSNVFQKDAASVIAAQGVPVHWLEGPNPTPLLAFSVTHLRAAAGVMITASHNPPDYNGYKAYWENGAQIVPPVDQGIAARIEEAPGASEIPRAETSPLIRHASGLEEAYLKAVSSLAAPLSTDRDLRVAYSALHGCGQRLFLDAMASRGFRRVHPVPEQAEPDPDFPTVSFPNPEEPGALDRVLDVARENDCDIALANDPDADRLGAAVRRGPGDYVPINGNELGILLGHHVLSHTREKKPFVISTIVSSRMLSKMAHALGVRYEDTLTGFKWIANEAIRIEAEEGVRFVFGYEEALGYTVGTVVRDKDGIGAGVTLAEMAGELRAFGRTLLDELESLRRRYGFFASRQRSVTLEGASGAGRIEEAMSRLRGLSITALAGEHIAGVQDRADGNVLLYDLEDGGRVAVRPSGTEPKIKLYLEVVENYDEPEKARERASRRLLAIEKELLALAGLA
ncbi:MAG: phospho-sugar mutase [Vicinamibacteria bacterium]